jgi:hypothetical protein
MPLHTHTEPEQACSPGVHVFPHAPQFFESSLRFTHSPPHWSRHAHPASVHFDGTPRLALQAALAPGSSSTMPSQLSSLPSHVSGTGLHVHVPGPLGGVTIGPCEPVQHTHPGRQSLAPQQGPEHTERATLPASTPCRYVQRPDWQSAPEVHGEPVSVGCADRQT